MRGNSHVRFLGGKGVAIPLTYPVIIDWRHFRLWSTAFITGGSSSGRALKKTNPARDFNSHIKNCYPKAEVIGSNPIHRAVGHIQQFQPVAARLITMCFFVSWILAVGVIRQIRTVSWLGSSGGLKIRRSSFNSNTVHLNIYGHVAKRPCDGLLIRSKQVP